MDKKVLLRNSLAKIMVSNLAAIKQLVQRFPSADISIKADGSPVTELDLALSALVEEIVDNHFPNYTFYSEEKLAAWKFPLVVVDPLDGTREYIEGRDEWAISIGVFSDEHLQGEGWVYNPLRGECFSQAQPLGHVPRTVYTGEVSRSEWKEGLFTGKNTEEFRIQPVGSIAYKLGRLSQGQCDFVVSLRPKNIWDVAGGTLLSQQAGFKFYSEGKEVTSVQELYRPPLIWCHPELFPKLAKLFP